MRFLQIQEVSHVGFAEEAATQPFFKLTVRPGKAVMGTKVLGPRANDKSFDITVAGLKIPADAPSRRAVAAPNATVLTHSLNEVCDSTGIHVVFNRDQDRAYFGIRVSDRRYAPVIPWRQIDVHVGQSQKQSEQRRQDGSDSRP